MPGPTGILDTLTADQKATILLWMETEEDKTVLQKVMAPPPEGFGIRTHITSLRRFFARHQPDERFAELELARTYAAEKNGEQVFITATQSILAEKAFQFLTSSDFRPKHFRTVSSWLLKIREQQLRRDQIQIARERWMLQR